MSMTKVIAAVVVVVFFQHTTALAQVIKPILPHLGAEDLLSSDSSLRGRILQEIKNPVAQASLKKNGIFESEFRQRIAATSDAELVRLSKDSRAGGEVVVISAGVLLLVLLLILLLRPHHDSGGGAVTVVK